MKKIFAEIFLWKDKFSPNKFDNKNFHQKKIVRKKNSKKNLKIILAIFLSLKKNTVEIRLIFEKKNREKFWK